MNFRKSNNMLLKFIDFITIDLFCLISAFFVAYYFKFNNMNAFKSEEWSSVFVMICCINLITMFCINPYRGIFKRRYYLQFRKEIQLFIGQFAAICLIFYALKIGATFSREMMFTMYFIYFFLSQVVKYFYKKIINKEFEILIKESNNKNLKTERDIAKVKEKNRLYKFIRMFIKRIIDICAGIVGCIILIPLIIIVFMLNRLNDEDGPIFYIQERIGKNGKKFNMYKFRSMCVDADEKLEEFLEENEEIREEFYIYKKIKNDPRITKVGEFLRKTSLDEFPQFINVLIGSMSLVRTKTVFRKRKRRYGFVL